MKKIMFFRPSFYMGGTEIAILNLIEDLSKEKYEIYIGYTESSSDMLLLSRMAKYSKACINILEEKFDENIDILIDCSPYKSSTIHFNRIKYNKLYLWFHHFGKSDEFIFNDIECIKKIDKIITVSEASKTILLRQPYGKYIKNKVYVIYNILNKNEVIEKSKVPIDINLAKDLNLITISRLTPEKGFARKLIIAEELKKKNIDFKWFIVGGNYLKNMEDEIKNMFLEFKDNFIFTGILDNPFNILNKCDYLVSLSDDETWGLSITESKLLGIPCIVTDFDVAYEQIEDMKNGIILSRTNTDSYKDRIDDILNNVDNFKDNLKDFKYDITPIIDLWNNALN